MNVTWEAMHGGWWAMDQRRRLVGEVVSYQDEARATYWAGFARRDRVPGRFVTSDDAQAAVAAALTADRA